MRREVRRQVDERLADGAQAFGGHAGIGAPVGARPAQAAPDAAEREDLLARHLLARGAKRRFERGAPRLAHLGQLRLVHHARLDKAFGVALDDRGVIADLLVHHRLRQRGIIELVVAVTAITHEVDEHVGTERLPIAGGQTRRLQGRLRIVGVDVKDGRAQYLRGIGGIAREEIFVGRCREADLVVDDDVDRPARGEAAKR